jgi:hypothetical protein
MKVKSNLFGYLIGPIVLGVIVGVLMILWKSTMTWLSAALGASIGWAIGFLATPIDKKEVVWFRDYAKVASAFATGFLVSKIDRLFELGVDENNGAPLVREAVLRNLMVAACCFFIAMISTYVVRHYGRDQP